MSAQLLSWQGRLLRLAGVLGTLFFSQFALAHLVETGHGTVNVVGKQTTLVISVPMAALAGADDNGDGLIDGTELRTHQIKLVNQVRQGVQFHNDGQAAQWSEMVLTLPAPAEGIKAPAKQLIAIGAATFEREPRGLTLHYALWTREGVSNPASTNTVPTKAERETLKVSVTRMQDGKKIAEEIGLLSPERPQWVFFAPVPHHVASFAFLGFEHIMGGADHLVFLVALLASGILFRRWVALLTAFTLAHGITFALASFGWVQAPASLVETAIAASIVLIAGLHLLKFRVRLGWELAMVFSLGLIHGLGFASAMQEEGAGQLIAFNPYPVWSILGFNLGIEAGQCLVAILLFGVIALLRRCFSRQQDAIWQQAAGVIAILMGTFWLIERTL